MTDKKSVLHALKKNPDCRASVSDAHSEKKAGGVSQKRPTIDSCDRFRKKMK